MYVMFSVLIMKTFSGVKDVGQGGLLRHVAQVKATVPTVRKVSSLAPLFPGVRQGPVNKMGEGEVYTLQQHYYFFNQQPRAGDFLEQCW